MYILLIRGAAFFSSVGEMDYSGYGVLSDWVYSLISPIGTGAVFGGIFLVFIQSLLINIIVAKFRMATTVTLFPGLFYALLVSVAPEFLALSPILLANTFFILALWELFESYRKNNVAGHIVNIGFWLGIASLFYFSEIVFLLLAFIGLNVLRAFRLNELLMLIIGFCVPYIACAVYFFWYDGFGNFWQAYVLNNCAFLDIKIDLNIATYINLALFTLISLVILFSVNVYYAKKNIQAQKNISVLFWGLFFGLLSFVFQSNLRLEHFLIFMVPSGILLSFNFLKLKPQTAEAVHLLLFAAILIWQFNPNWLNI